MKSIYIYKILSTLMQNPDYYVMYYELYIQHGY